MNISQAHEISIISFFGKGKDSDLVVSMAITIEYQVLLCGGRENSVLQGYIVILTGGMIFMAMSRRMRGYCGVGKSD